LLVGGGLFFFAVALLVSSLIEGEYTAPVVSFGIVLAIAVGSSIGILNDVPACYYEK
jgi:ABC-type transport system involved in multi-copper enzyme maturation permease subunit